MAWESLNEYLDSLTANDRRNYRTTTSNSGGYLLCENSNGSQFAIPFISLRQALTDLRDRLPVGPEIFESYNQDNWRHLCSPGHFSVNDSGDLTFIEDRLAESVFTDEAVKPMAIQIKPFFNGLARLISWANDMPYVQNRISLDPAHIENTIRRLDEIITEFAVGAPTVRAAGHAGRNVIRYGAPGTGKSHSLSGLTNIVRTVFHSEYLNSDFVGSYRPYRETGADGAVTITYRFVPGPFIKAFVNAIRHPDEHHHLVIEEINRANAGAVFGEIFQLLDRRPDGRSEYGIHAEASLSDYLDETLGDRWRQEQDLSGMLYIPANLSIFATMNSADQGVAPMDSAFKRRWEFDYLSISFENRGPDFEKEAIPCGDRLVNWRVFAEAINSVLSSAGIEEDRLIGPYFLSPAELAADNASLIQSIKGKLFIYLWDDVLRHHGRDLIFDDPTTFFNVTRKWPAENVFSVHLLQKITEIEAGMAVARQPEAAVLPDAGERQHLTGTGSSEADDGQTTEPPVETPDLFSMTGDTPDDQLQG